MPPVHQRQPQVGISRCTILHGAIRACRRWSSAAKAISSTPLLSNPLIVPELEDIFRTGALGTVLSESNYDDILLGGPAVGEASWTDEIGCLAHWAAVRRAIERIEAQPRPAAKLNTAVQLIDTARSLYDRLLRRGLNFDPQTGPDHLTSWRDSVLAFRQNVGV